MSVKKHIQRDRPNLAWWPATKLPTPINVVDAHYVVFAEIAADLNLHQFKRNPARIGKPVNTANWDIDGFILMHAPYVVADCDLGGPAHHHPMLGAMKVLL